MHTNRKCLQLKYKMGAKRPKSLVTYKSVKARNLKSLIKFFVAHSIIFVEKMWNDIKVWFRVEFIQLALEYKPLNLGQGLPDDLVPNYVIDSLRQFIKLCRVASVLWRIFEEDFALISTEWWLIGYYYNIRVILKG